MLLGRVTGVDAAAREVLIGERRIPYDYLIVATGARHAYFGHDEWEPFAPGLKKIEDATEIRRRILLAFEEAESGDRSERCSAALLTFVVVGGGPTGVELAGAIAEIARQSPRRATSAASTRARRGSSWSRPGRGCCPTFPERLSAIASARSSGSASRSAPARTVTACDAERRHDRRASGSRRATVLWAAGVAASPPAQWLGAEQRPRRAGQGRRPTSSLPGHPEIFVIGDTALVDRAARQPVAGIAPAAKQDGRYAARPIRRPLRGRSRHRRSATATTATSPRSAARPRSPTSAGSASPGWIAWLLWGVVHIFFLIGFRNRLVVALDWLWAYLTFQRGARLITGPTPE